MAKQNKYPHFKRPELRLLVGKREKVEFAQTVDEYSRRYKVKLKILKSRLFQFNVNVRLRKGI